jgi:DNA anti-recombination protein RmuC
LPALKQRYAIMQKECEKIKKELDKALVGWEKLSIEVKSSLEAVLTKIDDLKAEGSAGPEALQLRLRQRW